QNARLHRQSDTPADHKATEGSRTRRWSRGRDPGHIASSLKTRNTRTLGIIVPGMTTPYFPKLIRGAEAAARAKGYSLIAVNSDDDGDRQWARKGWIS